ncbi:hypothetical protein ACF0H5_008240 [Mactra antiquata]
MPAKRKPAGKKESVEAPRRSTRNASAGKDTGTKRKASPSPVPKTGGKSAKKGRKESASPAPEIRKPSRGKQAAAQKEETKPVAKASAKSTKQKGRVTRTVVKEVESKKPEIKKAADTKKTPEKKKPLETKSRSSSRAAKSPAPAKPSPQSKPKQKDSTPKQKAVTPRGRSKTPKKQEVSPQVTPKKQPATQKVTPKRNASPKAKKPTQNQKTSPKSLSSPKVNKESPSRPARSRRSKEIVPVEKSEEDEKATTAEVETKEDELVADETDQRESVTEEQEAEKSAELKDDEKTEEVTAVENVEMESTAQDEVENKESPADEEQTKKLNDPVETGSEPVTESDKDASKEEVNAITDVTEKVEPEKNGIESMETDDVTDNVESVESEKEVTNENEELSNDTKSESNEKDASTNNEDSIIVTDSSKEKDCIVENTDKNISPEVIGDAQEKDSNEISEFSQETEEITENDKDKIEISNVSNINETAGGSGDQIVIDNENEEESLVTDTSNDQVQENSISEKNNVESTVVDNIEELNSNQDSSEANDSNDVDDKIQNKRKFDSVDQDDDDSIMKKPKLVEEVDIQANGNNSCDDIAKDYVVIEMKDVPQPESSEVLCSLPNPIFNRPFIPNPAYVNSADSSKHFSVVSYNMLADCHLFRNDYSFTEEKYLQSDYRLSKVIEELRYLDADVLCMQEVDPEYYSKQLLPSLKGLGYDGLFKRRTQEYFNEGEATFYKTSRFTLMKSTLSSFYDLINKELTGIDPTIQEAVRNYMNLPDVVVITKLKCNNTGQEVTVGNVHIQWGQMKVPDAQCVQIASAVKEIVSNADGDVFPHIICGDFNSPPMSPGYLVARDGYPSGDETINILMQIENLQLPEGKKASLVNSLWPAFQHTSSSLRSAYSEAQGVEPDVSSFNRVMCHCVDYIFYSSMSLDNVGVLQLASKEKITETGGIPNCYFPSDHVSIKAVLSFK